MKLKITIAGAKVHDVGYRVFLMKNAMDAALPGLSTYNSMENERQEVIALIEGDEARVEVFKKLILNSKPVLAEVNDVRFDNYDGDVGKISEVAMLCTFVQLDKAIPLLLDIRDDLKEMKTDMKEIKTDIKAVRKNTDSIPQAMEEIQGLREDVQPGFSLQFRQVQTDIHAIKERLGML